MELLITTATPPTFWEIQNNQITRIIFPNLTEYDLFADDNVTYPSLPPELGEICLQYLLKIYLKGRAYDKAMAIAMSNKSLLRYCYTKFYEPPKIDSMDQFFRIQRTFDLLDMIDDHLISPLTRASNANLRIARPGLPYCFPPLRPWHFVNFVQTEPSFSRFVRGTEKLETFNTGPTIGDTVWVNGTYDRDGVMDTKRIYHPVINIILCDSADVILPTEHRLVTNKYFKQFTHLLQTIYGSNCLVNYMVKDDEEDPFVVETLNFISF